MTDNEIIKGVEICNDVSSGACRECPYEDDDLCIHHCVEDLIDLCKRQKAEIEKLVSNSDELKAETIKEFGFRLKRLKWSEVNRRITERDIDAITKEMMGDDK